MDVDGCGWMDMRFVMFKSCNSRPDFSLSDLTVCNSTAESGRTLGLGDITDRIAKYLCVMVRKR